MTDEAASGNRWEPGASPDDGVQATSIDEVGRADVGSSAEDDQT